MKNIRTRLEEIASVGILGVALLWGVSESSRNSEFARAHCYDPVMELVGGRMVSVVRNTSMGKDWEALLGYDLDGKPGIDAILVESRGGFQECPVERKVVYFGDTGFEVYLSALEGTSKSHDK